MTMQPTKKPSWSALAPYFLLGIGFGLVLTKGEMVSWFRVQEMFRFQGWHMYGVFATALPVAIISVQWLKRTGRIAMTGEPIQLAPKQWGTGARYIVGGVIFGLGWAVVGACPGPIFALIGSGWAAMALTLLGALAGTWTYGRLRPRLPH
jgi:uncharacterized protein